MKPLTLSLILTAALFLTAAAPEEPAMTAADLRQLCGGTDHVSVNACRIYMLGVTQGITVGLHIADRHQSRPCVPPAVAAEDLEGVLKKRLDTLDAATEQHDAAGFIGEALVTKYPCGRK